MHVRLTQSLHGARAVQVGVGDVEDVGDLPPPPGTANGVVAWLESLSSYPAGARFIIIKRSVEWAEKGLRGVNLRDGVGEEGKGEQGGLVKKYLVSDAQSIRCGTTLATDRRRPTKTASVLPPLHPRIGTDLCTHYKQLHGQASWELATGTSAIATLAHSYSYSSTHNHRHIHIYFHIHFDNYFGR
uniref:HDC13095 n=1 Tax=Drosophila melanogaster TaxID=7227 RepID=Q6IK95_DROME|nr:TPA_inf: HDC13095 [Drosophila melanogaster]